LEERRDRSLGKMVKVSADREGRREDELDGKDDEETAEVEEEEIVELDDEDDEEAAEGEDSTLDDLTLFGRIRLYTDGDKVHGLTMQAQT